MSEIKPTPEQQAFCKEVWEGRPCWLSARAGTGKTSTIKLVFDQAPRKQDCTVIAFNKKNQQDLALALGPGARVATLHSLGFAALRQYMPGLELSSSKLFELTKAAGIPGRKTPKRFSDTMRLVSCAKNWGVVPQPKPPFKPGLLPDSPETWLALVDHFELLEADLETAREILIRSNQEFLKHKTIDFDDMVYLPTVLGLQVFASEKLIVDEAQDLSPLNIKMLKRSPAKIWYVGDPYQCIYSWRGAAQEALEDLGLPELPLTTCWRCSSSVLKQARTWVPDIKARPNAPEGQVKRYSWMPDWAGQPPATILSRNNAALIKIALELREARAPVWVLGKDLARTLLDVLGTLKGQTRDALQGSLETWFQKMVEKYPHRAGDFKDLARCLRAFILSCHGKGQIEKSISNLFTDTQVSGAWTLSTIHRAKGQEWPTVWVLDWTTRATQPWQLREERNLRYVAATRAKENLYYVEEVAWDTAEAKGQDWRSLR